MQPKKTPLLKLTIILAAVFIVIINWISLKTNNNYFSVPGIKELHLFNPLIWGNYILIGIIIYLIIKLQIFTDEINQKKIALNKYQVNQQKYFDIIKALEAGN